MPYSLEYGTFNSLESSATEAAASKTVLTGNVITNDIGLTIFANIVDNPADGKYYALQYWQPMNVENQGSRPDDPQFKNLSRFAGPLTGSTYNDGAYVNSITELSQPSSVAVYTDISKTYYRVLSFSTVEERDSYTADNSTPPAHWTQEMIDEWRYDDYPYSQTVPAGATIESQGSYSVQPNNTNAPWIQNSIIKPTVSELLGEKYTNLSVLLNKSVTYMPQHMSNITEQIGTTSIVTNNLINLVNLTSNQQIAYKESINFMANAFEKLANVYVNYPSFMANFLAAHDYLKDQTIPDEQKERFYNILEESTQKIISLDAEMLQYTSNIKNTVAGSTNSITSCISEISPYLLSASNPTMAQVITNLKGLSNVNAIMREVTVRSQTQEFLSVEDPLSYFSNKANSVLSNLRSWTSNLFASSNLEETLKNQQIAVSFLLDPNTAPVSITTTVTE
jgi:hypothetical protein